MNCWQCGAPLPPDVGFCHACGAFLRGRSAPANLPDPASGAHRDRQVPPPGSPGARLPGAPPAPIGGAARQSTFATGIQPSSRPAAWPGMAPPGPPPIGSGSFRTWSFGPLDAFFIHDVAKQRPCEISRSKIDGRRRSRGSWNWIRPDLDAALVVQRDDHPSWVAVPRIARAGAVSSSLPSGRRGAGRAQRTVDDLGFGTRPRRGRMALDDRGRVGRPPSRASPGDRLGSDEPVIFVRAAHRDPPAFDDHESHSRCRGFLRSALRRVARRLPDGESRRRCLPRPRCRSRRVWRCRGRFGEELSNGGLALT